MRPLKRGGVNKYHSAKKFQGNTKHTKAVNLRPNPMRGGIRL